MREIKFRGMDIVNNKWLYGNLEIPLINQSKSKHFIIGYSYGQYQKHEVDPKTIGQYTGLKDCNGKEIFENDIVLVCESEDFKWKHQVEYRSGCFMVDENALGAIHSFCKVIGNIYENPEMILD